MATEDSPAVTEVSQEELEMAISNLQAGKKLIDDDPERAVELLQAAVRTHEKRYGGSALECAEVYMYYGIALYEIARKSNDAVGITKTDVQPIPDQEPEQAAATIASKDVADAKDTTEMDADTGAGEAIQAKDASAAAVVPSDGAGGAEKDNVPSSANDGDKNMAENALNPDDQVDAEKVTGDDAEIGEAGDDIDGGDDGDAEGGDEDAGGAEADAPKDADADDSVPTDDMQLAWEMLELARVIYSKHDEEKLHCRLAEVHKALGDIKGEQEQFEDAVECYTTSVEHLKAMQPLNNRRIAETQYKLSVILTYLERPEEALAQTTAALGSLEAAVAEVEEELAALPTDSCGGEEAEEKGRRLQATSDDLRAVMSELQCNLEGLNDTIAHSNKFKEALKDAFLKAGTAGSPAGAAAFATGFLGSDAAMTLSKTFAARSNSASASQPVSLGVVGRGNKRVTLQPISAPSTQGQQQVEAPSADAVAQAPTKRTLEDLMSGPPASGGDVTTGFCTVAVVDRKDEGMQPVKKARMEEAKPDSTSCASPEEGAVAMEAS